VDKKNNEGRDINGEGRLLKGGSREKGNQNSGLGRPEVPGIYRANAEKKTNREKKKGGCGKKNCQKFVHAWQREGAGTW